MVNPSAMQQLAREYRREDQQAAATHGVVIRLSGHAIRERLGWSLVGLGARLTRDDFLNGSPLHGRHVRGSRRVGAQGAGARRARPSLPLAQL